MSFGEQMQREFDENQRRRAEDQALIDGVLARLPEFRAQWEQQAAQFAAAAAAAGMEPTKHVIGKTPVKSRWFGLVQEGGEDIVVEAYLWEAAVILTDGRLRECRLGDGLDVPVLTGNLQPRVEQMFVTWSSEGRLSEQVVGFFGSALFCTARGDLVIDVGNEDAYYETLEARLISKLRSALQHRKR